MSVFLLPSAQYTLLDSVCVFTAISSVHFTGQCRCLYCHQLSTLYWAVSVSLLPSAQYTLLGSVGVFTDISSVHFTGQCRCLYCHQLVTVFTRQFCVFTSNTTINSLLSLLDSVGVFTTISSSQYLLDSVCVFIKKYYHQLSLLDRVGVFARNTTISSALSLLWTE